MSEFELIDEQVRDEVVYDDHHARVRWQLLALRPVDGLPVLAVQRTVAASAAASGPGDKGTVVLVHGLAQNHRSWQLSGRSLPAWLAERGYEVLNLDLRGHGLSRRLGALPARTVHDYVADLVRLIQALPRPPFVAGHSLGAAVALLAAPKVAMAGLIHWAGIYTFARQNPTIRGAARLNLALAGLQPGEAAMNWRPVGKLIAGLARIAEPINAVAPIRGWGYKSFERPLLQERVATGFDVTGLTVMQEMSRWALGEPIDDGSFAGLTELPLLIFSGEADKLATIDDGRACYQTSRSRDRTHVVFSRAEHDFAAGHLDIVIGAKAPRVVWPALLTWLDGRSGPATTRSP